jgi:hypothetical protein
MFGRMMMSWQSATTIHITGGILAPPMVVNGRLFVAGGWTDHTSFYPHSERERLQ